MSESSLAMRWLSWLTTLNLIDVLSIYLLSCFVVGTVLRLRNYRAMLGLIYSFPSRWPKLLALVKQYRAIFLRWPTILPIGLTLALMLANFLAARVLWSQAIVTFDDLRQRLPVLLAVLISGILMSVLDAKAVFNYGRIDRLALEENLDRAEHWLKSWKAPALRFITLGFINPRRIVNNYVQEALVKVSLIVNGQMWWWSLQIGARLVFGLTLWCTWVVEMR